MKISKQFSNYLLERTNKNIQFKNLIKKELSVVERRRYSPMVQSLEAISKEYAKQNEIAVELLDILVDIEELLNEVRYE